MRVAPKITLTEEVRQTLESWSRGRSTPARQVLRARIVLAAAGNGLPPITLPSIDSSKSSF